jgi:hypothetical protein
MNSSVGSVKQFLSYEVLNPSILAVCFDYGTAAFEDAAAGLM